MRLTPTPHGDCFETRELPLSPAHARPAEVPLHQNRHPGCGNSAPGAGSRAQGRWRMTPDPEELQAAFEDAAEMCGAVTLIVDFEKDDCAFVWCGPGIVTGFELTPEMTPEDVFVETLISIELSDDPEMN